MLSCLGVFLCIFEIHNKVLIKEKISEGESRTLTLVKRKDFKSPHVKCYLWEVMSKTQYNKNSTCIALVAANSQAPLKQIFF